MLRLPNNIAFWCSDTDYYSSTDHVDNDALGVDTPPFGLPICGNGLNIHSDGCQCFPVPAAVTVRKITTPFGKPGGAVPMKNV